MTIFIPAWNKGILEPTEKLEVHKRGLKHKAISIFVFQVVNCSFSKEHQINIIHPNFGLIPVVHIQIGVESSEDCSSRRIFEELGLKNLELRFIDQIEYKANVGSKLIEHEVVDCFSSFCETTRS